ncbi:hypothetical protein BS78_05G062100 [Paspalum vaginatum]|nr:hypothetical protein BS78_05G062100 [Paspalum vaginatum]
MLRAVLVCFIVFFVAAEAKTTAVDDLCGAVGSIRSRYGDHVTREQCMSVLCHGSPSPCAAARDAPSLATLAARLTVANATATREFVKATLATYPVYGDDDDRSNATVAEEEAKAGLRSCLELYTRAVPALEWAAGSVAAGRYRGAREVVNATHFVTVACEGIFYDATRQAVSKVDGGFFVMSAVASSILEFLLMNTTRVA